ncbi:hypothetical protein ACJX0J_008855, partial [Zea mays]
MYQTNTTTPVVGNPLLPAFIPFLIKDLIKSLNNRVLDFIGITILTQNHILYRYPVNYGNQPNAQWTTTRARLQNFIWFLHGLSVQLIKIIFLWILHFFIDNLNNYQ